tara:strand:+ start:611 stop:1069 length:459 start_codon:yes stop_codon:yes gene_type:complete
MKSKINELILTCFYIGKFKYAPGTICSLAVSILLFLSSCFFNNHFFMIKMVTLFIIVVLGFSSTYIYSKINIDGKDPSYIVVDEFIGMFISVLLINESNYLLYLFAFILFRFFDILKPSFIDHSQNMKYGMGIIMDDILSGIFVLLIMLTII